MRRISYMLAVCFVLLCAVLPAWAGETDGVELTLEETVRKALLHSKTLKISELELEESKEQVDDASRALALFNLAWQTEYVPGVERLFVAREQAKFAYQVAMKEHAAARDGVVLAAHKAYYDVLKAEAGVAAASAAVESNELKLACARASQAAGLLSRQALMGAETQVKASRAALAAAETELDRAYRALNSLIGFPEEARPRLVETVDFTPFTGDVGVLQSLALEESPKAVAARERADLTERLQGWDEGIFGDDVEKAELEASLTREQVEEQVRALYEFGKDYGRELRYRPGEGTPGGRRAEGGGDQVRLRHGYPERGEGSRSQSGRGPQEPAAAHAGACLLQAGTGDALGVYLLDVDGRS